LVGPGVRSGPAGPAGAEGATATPPHVMLIDIGLPGMDGYEVARRIRQRPELRGVVLVALTGYGRDEDRRTGVTAGFDHHLVKPVDPSALETLVAELTSGNGRSASELD